MPGGSMWMASPLKPMRDTYRSGGSNTAVAYVGSAPIVNVHGLPCPLHAPTQYERTDSESPAAVSVTCDPSANDAMHSSPQSMPGGSDVTVPEPVPVSMTIACAVPASSWIVRS